MTGDSSGDLGPGEYLFYRLVQRMQAFDDPSQISKTRLFKFSCETDHYLEEEVGERIEFPRYWYQYGEMPNLDSFNLPFIKWDTVNGYNIATLEDQVDSSVFGLSEELRERIDTSVAYIVRKLHEYSTDEVVEYHYEHRAPREFVRKYDSFRKRLDNADFKQGTLSKFNFGNKDHTTAKEQLQDDLKQLVITYPERYESMEESFLLWEDTMQILFDEGELEDAQGLASKFWTVLSRAELRIHHNKDIPSSQIELWKDDRSKVVSDFLEEVRDIRSDILKTASIEQEIRAKETVDEVVEILGGRKSASISNDSPE
jgi:hypothetical protein